MVGKGAARRFAGKRREKYFLPALLTVEMDGRTLQWSRRPALSRDGTAPEAAPRASVPAGELERQVGRQVERDRHPHQLGQGSGAHLLHDVRAAELDRSQF